MGKIAISTNVSLDAVVQDPDGTDGFRLGGWFDRAGENNLRSWAKVEFEEAMRTAALLLGRRSDEWFAARWVSRSGEWADRLNGLPKYVVSSTLDRPRWSNATVLRGDLVDEVSRLKQEIDGDIVVYGSNQLGRTLMDNDLVDELRLCIFPVVVGAGERLFGEVNDKKPLHLVNTLKIGDSLALLTYQAVRDASLLVLQQSRRRNKMPKRPRGWSSDLPSGGQRLILETDPRTRATAKSGCV